jgi:hypothetical protein
VGRRLAEPPPTPPHPAWCLGPAGWYPQLSGHARRVLSGDFHKERVLSSNDDSHGLRAFVVRQANGARTPEHAAELAASIAGAARANSLNQHFRSPWIVAVRPALSRVRVYGIGLGVALALHCHGLLKASRASVRGGRARWVRTLGGPRAPACSTTTSARKGRQRASGVWQPCGAMALPGALHDPLCVMAALTRRALGGSA